MTNTLKTDRFRFHMIREAFFPDASVFGVEMTDITTARAPFIFTAEEAMELGHKLVEAGSAALTLERKRTR
jgi:hypothetical protein